jgi:hypothetical protein
MPTCDYTQRAFPFLSDFSTRDRRLADRAFNQQDLARRKASESSARLADEAVENLRRQLHDLVGTGRFADLTDALQRERLALRDLWQPPVEPGRDDVKQKAASRRKVDSLLRKLQVRRQDFQRIGGEFRERIEDILSDTDGTVNPGFHLPTHLETWTKLSPLHESPLPWGTLEDLEDPSNPHRWFLFRPPFFGFLFRFAPQASSNFRVDRQLFLSPPAGLVGNEATMDCGDASDFDFASVTAEAQVAVGFQAPATGLVEVLIDAQSSLATHRIEIDDEFGFSNAWCNQNNYLMMNVLHPNVPVPSLALMSNLYRESDGDDLTANRENLIRGQHYYAQLFSSGPVPAGQSVVVTVGTRTFDIARANDMEVHSRTNFQWFINSIEIRIAP